MSVDRRKALLALLAGGLGGCGYRVSRGGDLIPKSVGTIAVQAFTNLTTRYKFTDRLAIAVAREFVARTRYQVIGDESQADAVLRGVIQNVYSYPTLFDPNRGRAAAVQLGVSLSLTLVERATGKVLFNRPSFNISQRYEISSAAETADDPRNLNLYFDESDVALERVSREVAKAVVSAVLEAF